MDLSYPAVGFHFLVVFELFPQLPHDLKFQEVSGLNVTMETEPLKEGGENRFVHQLPIRTSYTDLVLKRGVFLGSGLLDWFKDAMQDYQFKPVNVMISLLNDDHLPLYNWYVINAIPKKFEISGFNAERSELVIQTMTLGYQYFKYYDPSSVALDLAGSLTGSINANIGF
ncbi:phage tail protein [Paraflavitalea speifideaquila]|uniref:phage tail protein n=1 Tax=Paraflavitalea speifideaquila TaxID=3076558 RepID=UPI0028F13FD1|nr:phage tail protein [Paraflavitalea speifideiaquila]